MTNLKIAHGFFTNRKGRDWTADVYSLQKQFIKELATAPGCDRCNRSMLMRKYNKKLAEIGWQGT